MTDSAKFQWRAVEITARHTANCNPGKDRFFIEADRPLAIDGTRYLVRWLRSDLIEVPLTGEQIEELATMWLDDAAEEPGWTDAELGRDQLALF